MKKMMVVLVGLLMISSLVSAEVVMKVGHSMPTETPRHQSLLKFEEMVEANSNGEIQVEIYPSGQLGNESEMIEMMKLGSLEAFRGGVFEAQTPKLELYTMPFLFNTTEDIYKITRGPIGEKIAATAEANGLKILATGDAGGFRNFTNNVRPITKPEDMEGLKMRTPPVTSIIKTMEALGANPVSIPYVETYMALKTGVADGQENPFVNIATMKFHEVQKYLTIINYQFHPEPFTVGLDWFNSLSEEHQNIVQDAAKEALILSDSLIAGAAEKALATIQAAGLEINELTPEQKQPFIEKAQAVYDFYNEKGTITMEELDEIRNALNE